MHRLLKLSVYSVTDILIQIVFIVVLCESVWKQIQDIRVDAFRFN